MDIDMTIREAKLRIVIGIKNPICTDFATQPVTSALNVPFIVRIQDAGGGVSVIVEYKNRRYVICGMAISKRGEELLAAQTSSTRIPCNIASNKSSNSLRVYSNPKI